MAKDLRSENDNLQAYRTMRGKLTENLLKKSLEELVNLKAIINQKTACEMMQKLATEEDKKYQSIISTSAISKNEVYKNMVLEAKEKINLLNPKIKEYLLNGDKKLELFQIKQVVAKKEAKIQELESIIDRANLSQQNLTKKIEDQGSRVIDFKAIAKHLVEFIIDEGVAFLDNKNNLIIESTGNILITFNTMEELK